MSTPNPADGPVLILMHAHRTAACPDHNDPSTAQRIRCANLREAREWLSAHGGYASLPAGYSGSRLNRWSVMRRDDHGHYEAGVIYPDDPQRPVPALPPGFRPGGQVHSAARGQTGTVRGMATDRALVDWPDGSAGWIALSALTCVD